MIARIRQLLGRKFVRDAAWLQSGSGLQTLASFGTSIGLAFLLGPELLGNYFTAVSLYSLLFFTLNPGVPQVVVARLSEAVAAKDQAAMRAWMAYFVVVSGSMGALLLAAGSVLGPIAEQQYGDAAIGRWAWVLCVTALAGLPQHLVVACLQATRRMDLLARLEGGGEVVRTICTLEGAVLGGLPGAVLGFTVAQVLLSFLALSVWLKADLPDRYGLPRLRTLARSLREAPVKTGLKQGILVGLNKNIAGVVYLHLPSLVLAGAAGPSAVAFFRIALRLMSVPQTLGTGIGRTLLPAMGQLKGRGEAGGVGRALRKVTLGSGCLMAVVVAGFLLFVPVLVGAFYGDGYSAVVSLAVILGVGAVGLGFAIGQEAFYIVTGRLALSVKINGCLFLALLPIMVWMIRGSGATGAAWFVTTAQCTSLIHLAMVGVILRREARAARLEA